MAILWESLVRPADLTTFVRNVPLDQSYVLNQILPDRTVNDEEVNVANVTVTARTAKVRAFDAPAAPITRDTYGRTSFRPLPVSATLAQGEVDKRRLAVAAARGGSDSTMIQAIYNDAENCARAVGRRVELMRGDAISDGKVTIANENGVTTEADYQVPGGNIATAATLWSDPDAPILTDLRTWSRNYRNVNGFAPGGILMSEDTWFLMAANNKIKALYPNQGVAAPIISADQVDNALRAYRLPPIMMTYDAQVDVDGVTTSILPKNKIFFLPPAGVELGYTFWALTVTGTLATQAGQIPFSPAGPGNGMVGVYDINSAMPYNEAVYVDSCPLPVITNPKALAIYTVAA